MAEKQSDNRGNTNPNSGADTNRQYAGATPAEAVQRSGQTSWASGVDDRSGQADRPRSKMGHYYGAAMQRLNQRRGPASGNTDRPGFTGDQSNYGHQYGGAYQGNYGQQSSRQWTGGSGMGQRTSGIDTRSQGTADWNRDNNRDWNRDNNRDWSRDNNRDWNRDETRQTRDWERMGNDWNRESGRSYQDERVMGGLAPSRDVNERHGMGHWGSPYAGQGVEPRSHNRESYGPERTSQSRWTREPTTAAEVMTRSPKCVSRNSTLREAAQVMKDENCGIVPVVDDQQRLIGVLTDRDIVMRAFLNNRNPTEIRVEDAMTDDVEAVTGDEDLTEVVELMGTKQIRRVPVVDREDRLVGIISMGDVARRADVDEQLQHALERISSKRSFWSRLWS